MANDDEQDVNQVLDTMLPAQAVYAAAVVAAETAYRDAVNAAWKIRKQTIDDALATCLIAMKVAR